MSFKEPRFTKIRINSTVVLAAILVAVVVFIAVINVWPESEDAESYVDVTDMPIDISTYNVVEDIQIRNFVDKRYELVLLVFRLSDPEHQVFAPRRTDHQRNLDETFADFADHPAVEFIRNMHTNWNSAFDFAVSIYWNGDEFALIDDTRWIVNIGYSRWLHISTAKAFLELLNDFYIDTNFDEFFLDNKDYFMEDSIDFAIRVYSNFNAEWFRQFGLNPDNLHVAISPSKSDVGFAAWFENENLYDKIVYATSGACVSRTHFMASHMTIVHEFAHAIADPIANRWFSQDLQFWTWARSSAGSANTFYPRSQQKAQEYVTRALTILYFLDNTNHNLQTMFSHERREGFHHIAEVFDMLMHYLGRYDMVQGE